MNFPRFCLSGVLVAVIVLAINLGVIGHSTTARNPTGCTWRCRP